MNDIFTSELFGTVMQILIPVLATAIGAVITAVAARVAAKLKEESEKIKEEKAAARVVHYINILEQTVVDVVKGLNQSTVSKLKEAAADGKLTPEEIEKVSADAKATIIAILGPTGIEILHMAFADINSLVALKIERVVGEVKLDKAA